MVRAGTHVNLSVSMCGWAHSQLDTGPTTFLTYLLLIYFMISNLLHSVVPKDPKSRCLLMMTILWGTPWPPRGHRGTIIRQKHRQKVRPRREGKTKFGQTLRAHLFAMAITSFRVGCCIESHLHRIFNVLLHLTALLSSSGDPDQVRFDSNSFPICIDNHASYCMANSPHLFENLVLSDVGKVDGINEGLEIAGKGTFKFMITDDNGRAHIIRIPNLLYLPELKSCLLLPQHWAQEVGDRQTWMVNLNHHCILQWADGRKTVPFNKSSNTPVFYTVFSSRAYQAFAGTFEALEAPFFQRETVIQIPGCRLLREDTEITPEEFIAKEELPQGVKILTGNSKDHVLNLLKNIYGQKQAGRVWNSFLVDKLKSLGYSSSLINDCVFFRDDIIFMVYMDDCIFLGNNDAQLQQVIKEIQDLGLNIEDQDHPADYVGVSIKKLHNGSYEFTQRALINAIINDIGLNDSRTKPVPAKVSLRLHAFKDEPTFDLNFNYRSVVGKLNFLIQTTRPDIMYAIHQIAKYSSDPH
jgi:hypothetical protein